MNDRQKEKSDTDPIIKCDSVQELLMEYAARELGESRSALVREHLLYCDSCKDSFNEIMETISALEGASAPNTDLPSSLSEKHYKRVIRALTHPVLDWIIVNHKIVAAVITALVLIITAVVLNHTRIFKVEKIEDMGYEVYINVAPDQVSSNGGPVIIWRSYKEPVDE